jgi:signal transduction histidine kinase/ActR/RegA family two-component response regulator
LDIEGQQLVLSDIQDLQASIDGLGDITLGNLSVIDALKVNSKYWNLMSEHALKLGLLRTESSVQLYKLLDATASVKTKQSTRELISHFPQLHQTFVNEFSESSFAAISRDMAELLTSTKGLEKPVQDYLTLVDAIYSQHQGFYEAVSELQALRHERQYDLLNILDSVQIQAEAINAQLQNKKENYLILLVALVIILGLMLVLRSWNVSRTMRLQARELDANQAYMMSRLKISETSERAKTSFLSVVSYEARTALDAILGLTRLAQHSSTNPDQEAKLDEVINSSNKLNALLDDVLNFIDLELGAVNLEAEPFAPKKALAILCDKFSELAEQKHILFEHNIDPSLNDVYLGDQQRFFQVFDCLLSNALRYTDKGHVTLSVSVDSAQSLSPELQRLNVTIEDTGISLTKEEAAALFDPFATAMFKSSRKSGGSGVRLSTASRLVEMMDGELEVESSQGHGVKFNLYFHLSYADAGVEAISTADIEAHEQEESVDLQHLNILVVEDNLTNSTLMKWILEDFKHTVDVAENGVECLNLLEAKDYDLIFMDQHMPEMDGDEATRKIREREDHKATIPIIGCTADAFQETKDALIAAGQNEVIVKPISNDIVFDVTQKMLRGEYKALPKQPDSAVEDAG